MEKYYYICHKLKNKIMEEKFAEFDEMLELFKKKHKNDKNAPALLIHHPEVLGDNYDELVQNLNKLADAKMTLMIIPQVDRE